MLRTHEKVTSATPRTRHTNRPRRRSTDALQTSFVHVDKTSQIRWSRHQARLQGIWITWLAIGVLFFSFTMVGAAQNSLSTTCPAPAALDGVPYSSYLIGSGGMPPYSWTVTRPENQPPSGLSLDSNTGLVAGTPDVSGELFFNFTITDAAGATAMAGCNITVSSRTAPSTASAIQIISGNQQSTSVGQALNAPMIVEVLDAHENPVPYTLVKWSVSRGAATLTQGSSLTDAHGEASAQVAASAPGTIVIHASAGMAGVDFDVVAGPSAFRITNGYTIGSLLTDANGNALYCSAPPAKSTFLTTDPSAGVWFTVEGGNSGDVLTVNWVHPSGSVDDQHSTITLTAGGSGCYAAFLGVYRPRILGPNSSTPTRETETGNWQVRILLNGITRFTLPFRLTNPLTPNQAFVVTARETIASLVTSSSGTPDYCRMPAATSNFSNQDSQVGVWFSFNGGETGDVLAINWIHPSGAIDSLQPDTILGFNGSACLAWFMPISGTGAAVDPGEWSVRLLLNGSPVFSLPFIIANLGPSMISPVPGSTLGGSTVTFNWTPVKDAQLYILEISQRQAGLNDFLRRM